MKQLDIFENEKVNISNKRESNKPSESEIYDAYEEINASGKSIMGIRKTDMILNPKTKENIYNQHSLGIKLDDDKPDLDLVLGDFAKALQEVGKIGTFGAKKYSEHGWLSVPNAPRRYSSALLRHTFQYKEGDELDEESGFSHLAHAAWNALAVLELYLRSKNE